MTGYLSPATLLVIPPLADTGCTSKKGADSTKQISDHIFSDNEIEIEHPHARQEDSQLVIDEVQMNHSGNYSCMVINIHGSDSILYSLHVHCKLLIFPVSTQSNLFYFSEQKQRR